MAIAPSRRIVLLGPSRPYRGGIAHFTEQMRRHLAARGDEVLTVTFTRQYPAFLFPGRSQYEDGADAGDALRLVDTLNPLSWRRTARRIRALAPDAVVIAYWMPFFAPAFAAIARALRRDGVRTVALLHNVIPHERHPGDAWLSRRFLKACDAYLVLSAAVERDVRALGIDGPMERVEHPVYNLFGAAPAPAEARRQLGLPADAEVLLFFGFIRAYKGLDVLLESLPAIVTRRPNALLVVAGESYEDVTPLQHQAAGAGVAGHVRLDVRYIPTDDVARYFAAADLVVQPYRSATQSGVAQIAFHFEKPLVVTDVGGLAEAVPHERAGFVVPPADAKALADAVVRYFEEDWRDRLTAGVREEKKKYSWDRLYEAMDRLIEP